MEVPVGKLTTEQLKLAWQTLREIVVIYPGHCTKNEVFD